MACGPGRNEAAARWVAPISRGGPFWAPGGGGGEAGCSPRPGSPLRQLLLTAPRQHQPGRTRSSMLVPGSTRPSSDKRQVRATCRRAGDAEAGVGLTLSQVRCQLQPGPQKWRARASWAGALQLGVPVCEGSCRVPGKAICVWIGVFRGRPLARARGLAPLPTCACSAVHRLAPCSWSWAPAQCARSGGGGAGGG